MGLGPRQRTGLGRRPVVCRSVLVLVLEPLAASSRPAQRHGVGFVDRVAVVAVAVAVAVASRRPMTDDGWLSAGGRCNAAHRRILMPVD
jgi:hypothetical protein